MMTVQSRVESFAFDVKSPGRCIQVVDLMRIKADACWLVSGFVPIFSIMWSECVHVMATHVSYKVAKHVSMSLLSMP